MIIAKVGRRGRITIPRAIRRRLDLQEGDQIAFIYQDNGIVLRPLTKTLFDLRGSIPVSGPQDFSAIRRQAIEAHVGKSIRDGS